MKVYDDPELWKTGEVKSLPTIDGRGYLCRITRVLPAVIEFDGPTGPACITRSLYATLTRGEQ